MLQRSICLQCFGSRKIPVSPSAARSFCEYFETLNKMPKLLLLSRSCVWILIKAYSYTYSRRNPQEWQFRYIIMHYRTLIYYSHEQKYYYRCLLGVKPCNFMDRYKDFEGTH